MYIIDPMTFYWIHAVDTARLIVALCFGFSGVAAFVLLGAWIGDWACDYDTSMSCKKWFVRMVVVTAVFGIALVFIPNRTTMIEMLIAKTATIENAELTVDALKSAVDYIVEAMKSIK